ncbi:MAG TPA: hypothetical protein PKJ21_08185 [Anaerolineae bacterium]|nr:hypothetical protein [Anaerolineae bacterium]HQJ52091.1 hypothetical protein [Anaerolineae bacterium]
MKPTRLILLLALAALALYLLTFSRHWTAAGQRVTSLCAPE